MHSSAAGHSEGTGGQIAGKRKTKRVLNVPLLVGTLIAAAVLGPATYAWRSYQIDRTADRFLKRADSLEEEAKALASDPKKKEEEVEKWGEAAGYLRFYLRLRPDEPEVWARLAETFDKSAQHGGQYQAVKVYYQTLGIVQGSEEVPADKQRALRCRLGELLLELQQGWAAIDPGQARQFGNSAQNEAEKLLQLDQGGVVARG